MLKRCLTLLLFFSAVLFSGGFTVVGAALWILALAAMLFIIATQVRSCCRGCCQPTAAAFVVGAGVFKLVGLGLRA